MSDGFEFNVKVESRFTGTIKQLFNKALEIISEIEVIDGVYQIEIIDWKLIKK